MSKRSYHTEVRIHSVPGVSGGAPVFSNGVRLIDPLDRIRVGEGIEAVATDYGLDLDELALAVEIADALDRALIVSEEDRQRAIEALPAGLWRSHLMPAEEEMYRDQLIDRVLAALTQQSSGGQEGGVEEAVSQFCGTEHHVLCPGCSCSCHVARDLASTQPISDYKSGEGKRLACVNEQCRATWGVDEEPPFCPSARCPRRAELIDKSGEGR